ncbi:hypothetical protein QBC46DRAFT_393350 [Diplogelasinospora grovesii]|uniref:Rhodopsin domain-containing protein n=1 Tax=Diplogelasinospora grovesii TaxID=303347 RepID=A0AAN6N203_9PEZI|nr:hypothetical protein QBC46DRAFT_393350 [Diplogelasinospora grovesii]
MLSVGFFVHQWNTRLKDLAEVLYIIHIGSNVYTAVLMCMKAAILLEWLHLFCPTGERNTFFWAAWAVLCVNTLFYAAGIFAENLSCIPYQGIWDKTIPARCLDQKVLDVASACINLASDICILVLPQPIIWGLQISLHKKIGVSLIFAMGVFACVAAAFRLAATTVFLRSDDVVYAVSAVALWCLAEMMAVLLVFCVPALPKVIRDTGVATMLAASLRSLTGRGSHSSNRKGSSNISTATLPASASPATKKLYRKLDKDSLALSQFPVKGPEFSDSTERLQDSYSKPTAKSGILRTSQLTHSLVKEDPRDIANELHGRQHPWVGK